MLPTCLAFYQQRVNHALEHTLSIVGPSQRLHDAMHYVMLDSGKRFRAALVYATTEVLHGSVYLADQAACAIELVHAYSLIHDDLPAMDDDDWRRGKPTCHKQFDEATAILAGDALQSLAFELLAEQPDLSDKQRIQQITSLAKAIGYCGMAAGQSLDIAAIGHVLTQHDLETMHSLKTGALIQACIEVGAYCVSPTPTKTLSALQEYARCVGLAFQVHDDVLDVIGSKESLGKQAGVDASNSKPTFVSLLGIEKSTAYAHSLITHALEKTTIFGDRASNLRELALFCIERAQ